MFGLFSVGPVRSLRSFRTKDITAHIIIQNMHIKKTKFSLILR